ncbi:MAG: AAA family ATPase [Syntrophobacteraceae bacterium]
MYQEFFLLQEAPFTIAPDPRYLYLSDQHREALAHLLYGVKGDGGFVLLTGEVGTGKTTICRGLVEQLPSECDVALVFNPRLTVVELLSTVCEEFGVGYPRGNRSIKVFVDQLNAYLLDAHSKGRKSVLIIDEAQNLSASVLEQMRLLTNLETNQRKLLQIILLGQPELRDMLERPELRQLAQRIVARYHLGPLNREDTEAYVHHRLAVAGARQPIFSPSSLRTLYRLTGGIPRLINIVADRALLGAYVEGKGSVSPKIIETAAREAIGERSGVLGRLTSPWTLSAMAVGVAGLLILGKFLTLAPLTDLPAGGTTVSPVVVDVATPKSVRKPLPAQLNPDPSNQTPEASQHSSDAHQAVETSKMSTLEWRSDKPIAQSEPLAFQALLELWNARSSSSEEGRYCQRAEASGLQCFTGRGSLQDLLRLNHPAVLRLQDSEGQSYYATIAGVQDRTVTVVMGGEPRTVPLSEVEHRWKGDFTLFWRPPPQYGGTIQLGDRGPAVEWLRTSLAKAEGRPEAAHDDSKTFDQSFQETVKRFQSANGLKSDGIVGPQTIIRLNVGIYSGDPHLAKARKDG